MVRGTGFSLSGFSLKLIAIIAMAIDHIAAVFFPQAYFLRFIGRLTLPIMAFLVAEGYFYTRDPKKYCFRLFMAGIISQIPFSLAFDTSALNIMFTLTLSVLALAVLDSKLALPIKYLLVCLLVFLTGFCDWPYFAALYVIFFSRYRGDFPMQALSFAVISIFMWLFFGQAFAFRPSGLYSLGVFMALPLLSLYNGKRGHDIRLLFYGFYPLHLIVIVLINYLV